MRFTGFLIFTVVVAGLGCAGPYHGPDKQFAGTLQGAATGAGAGAVTGAQLAAGTGPGALIGAGFGAVAGAIQGIGKDDVEEDVLLLSKDIRRERSRAVAQEILSEHYQRRVELHPTRDIYPADLFFYGDEVKLRPSAVPIVREMARLNKERLAWSRLVVAAYAKASDDDSEFARHLAERRSRELCDQFVRAGIEPRRLETRAVVMNIPILIDPYDRPDRYSQAIELIPLDR